MIDSIVAKPFPLPDASTAPFFDGARQHQFMLQHCAPCGHYSFLGGKYCPQCLAELTWVPASKRARVFSFTRVYQKVHPGFFADTPYLLVVGKMEQGPLLTLRLIETSEVRIGDLLEVHFVDNGEAAPTPVFRLVIE